MEWDQLLCTARQRAKELPQGRRFSRALELDLFDEEFLWQHRTT